MKGQPTITLRLTKGKDGMWEGRIIATAIRNRTKFTVTSGKTKIPIPTRDLVIGLQAAGSTIQRHMLPRLQQMVDGHQAKKEGA